MLTHDEFLLMAGRPMAEAYRNVCHQLCGCRVGLDQTTTVAVTLRGGERARVRVVPIKPLARTMTQFYVEWSACSGDPCHEYCVDCRFGSCDAHDLMPRRDYRERTPRLFRQRAQIMGASGLVEADWHRLSADDVRALVALSEHGMLVTA